MKKTSTILVVLFFVINYLYSSKVVAQAEWLDVASSNFAGGKAGNHALVIDKNGNPWVAYSDNSMAGKAIVRKFDGTNWVTMGISGISAGYANEISLAVDKNNTVYIAFTDNGTAGKANVKKFNGASWVSVGEATISNSYADGISLVIDGAGTPYIAFTDNGLDGKAFVKKFDGAAWQEVGTTGFSVSYSDDITLALDQNNSPYVAYTSAGKAVVKKFDGSSWSNVGTTGFSTGSAYDTYLTIAADGTPYVVYRDFRKEAADSMGKMQIKKFNGTNWEEVGQASFSDSWVYFASLVIDNNNIPYVAYRENVSGIGNPGKTKVKRYNSREWEDIGTTGISTGSANDVALAISETGLMYVAFADNSNNRKATVFKLALPSPVITSISNDTGTDKDRITSDRTLLVNGTAMVNAVITVFKNGIALNGPVSADKDGNWSYNYQDVALGEGTHVFTAKSNVNGVISVTSADFVVAIDTTAPPVPVLATEGSSSTLIPSAIKVEGGGNLGGTAEPGATVSVNAGALPVGSVQVAPNGNWAITNTALADGTYQVTATVSDAAGNKSPETTPVTIIVDTNAPAMPAILALAPGSDSGINTADAITNVGKPIITGNSDVNALITIYVDGTIVGTTTGDNNGKWTYTFATALVSGKRIITAIAKDVIGNISPASTPFSIQVDQAAPVVTGVVEGGAYQTNKTITFNEGTATLNNVAFASGTLLSTEGNHILVVTDVAGNSTTVRFSISKTVAGPSIVINNNAAYTNSNQVTLSLNAPGAVQMRFYDDNDNLTWTAWQPYSATKLWSLSTGNGSKWVKLQVKDKAGNYSVSTYDGIILDQTVPVVTISSSASNPTSASSVQVKFTFSEVVTGFTANDIVVTNAAKGAFAGSGKYYTLNVLPSATGTISVNVAAGAAIDVANNINSAAPAFSISYVVPVTAPVVTTSAVSAIASSSATFGGNVTATGGATVTERGFVYSKTTTTPTVNSTKIIIGSGLGAFSKSITGLTSGSVYYVRAYARNSKGISYGAVQKFATVISTTSASTAARVGTAEKAQTEVAMLTKATLSSYPNPFQDNATISFAFPSDTEYQLTIFDLNGRLISHLKAGKAMGGEQIQINWSAINVPNGLYIIQLNSNAGVQTLKVACNK